MPLTPYLKEAVFEPKTIEAMNAAFEAVCKSLQLVSRDDPITQIVARAIVDIVRMGEHDAQRIHELALLELNDLNQGSA
jgi:hypothetical protein